jgi:hypothetical protein
MFPGAMMVFRLSENPSFESLTFRQSRVHSKKKKGMVIEWKMPKKRRLSIV